MEYLQRDITIPLFLFNLDVHSDLRDSIDVGIFQTHELERVLFPEVIYLFICTATTV